jgi:predicted  nucleic acid-binding Zn-ribbon protein
MTETELASIQIADLRKQLQEAKHTISCLSASRDAWQRRAKTAEAQIKGKITPEWLAAYEAGAKPIEG